MDEAMEVTPDTRAEVLDNRPSWDSWRAREYPVLRERESVSDGGCGWGCVAHERPCILRAHPIAQPCHCVSCPWPASPRMVRRATR